MSHRQLCSLNLKKSNLQKRMKRMKLYLLTVAIVCMYKKKTRSNMLDMRQQRLFKNDFDVCRFLL
jgi:hypothetical protein